MTLDEGGWRRPTVRIVPAPDGLRDLVEFFWVDEWTDDSATAHSFRVVADDAPHLLWYLHGDRLLRTQRMSVAGPRARHVDVDLSGRRVMAGARLMPGAIPLLFGVPALVLTNRSVPLAEIASPDVSDRARAMRVGTRSSLVDDLAALLDRMRGRRIADSRATWIASQDRAGSTSVSSFAQTFAMPSRSVRWWSSRTLGMGLKRLLKIRRLHAALELRLSDAHRTWSQIAALAGYADQPHLIRDCRLLLGESPSEFAARAGPRVPSSPDAKGHGAGSR